MSYSTFDLNAPFSTRVSTTAPLGSCEASCTAWPSYVVMLYPRRKRRSGFSASMRCSSICSRCCSSVSRRRTVSANLTSRRSTL